MSTKEKKRHREQTGGFRSWEFVVGVVIAIGVVVAIFIATDAPTEKSTESTAPPPARSPAASDTDRFSPERMAFAERIDVEAAKNLLEEGRAVAIDVRSVDSYTAGHIPGALQIPLQYVAGEVRWFPRDRLIITYCA